MRDKIALLCQQIDRLGRLRGSSILLVRRAPQGISGGKGRLGIFPASFNPPTKAHLALIRKAKRQGNLDEILVLLDAQAMDKEIVGAGLEDRLIMLKMLFQKDPKVSIGISNQGLFVEKLLPLRELYPFPISFSFIVGFDTILRVMDKKYYQSRNEALDRLFGQCQFLVASREGKEWDSFEEFFRKGENHRYKEKVFFFTLPSKFSFHSSSLVRTAIAQNDPVDDFLPASVLGYIQKMGLYRD